MIHRTIAVLPFVNMSADPENEYFSDGITEEIISALARIKNLKVISRTSSFYFKNKNIPVKEIAHQLGVGIVLEGSVRMASKKVRITAQLIQAEEDFHFWSESWDRNMEDIFEIQDEVSLLIADKLREHLGHFEIDEHLVKHQTDNLDAYQYSLKARYYFNKWNPGDVQKAIDLYHKAVALDARHVESHTGLADAYGFMATTEFMPRQEAWEKAADYTRKAYELDPQDASVHYQLANLAFFTACDFAKAAEHTFRSIELRASYPEARQFLAFLYMLSGNMKKADQHLQVALETDPFNQETLFYQAYYFYRNGAYHKALDQLDDCLEKNPKNIPALLVKCYCLITMGAYQNALEMVDAMPKDIAIPDEQLGIRCLAWILNGERDKAENALLQLQKEAQNPSSFQAHSYLFLAYANLGRYDEAFEWLEQSVANKSSIFLLSYSDPLVDGLTGDPRYRTYHRLLYPPIRAPKTQIGSKPELLDPETTQIFTTKLLEFMEKESPYLNPELTLRSLASQVALHPNQLSWLLNGQIGKNFSEFVNTYRLEYFKQLVKDPANSHISLIGLAYESGFNSKTVFNTFFRKEVGMTPTEFLKSN